MHICIIKQKQKKKRDDEGLWGEMQRNISVKERSKNNGWDVAQW
jgi:hypothetical protein